MGSIFVLLTLAVLMSSDVQVAAMVGMTEGPTADAMGNVYFTEAVSGRILKLLPHAYVIMTADNVGVLVHLGLDTVALNGEGFTTRVKEGDNVTAGQVIITYDVPSVEAKGLNPIVPVVVMDEREAGNIVPADAVAAGADIASGGALFTANK